MQNYLKGPDEMRLAFREYPEALESAVLVAEMCDQCLILARSCFLGFLCLKA